MKKIENEADLTAFWTQLCDRLERARASGGISHAELGRMLDELDARGGWWQRIRGPLGMAALVAVGVGGFMLGGFAGITIRLARLLDVALVAVLRALL